MQFRFLTPALLLCLAACSPKNQAEAEIPDSPPPSTTPTEEEETTPELSEEEKAKLLAAEKLAQDREQMRQAAQTESQRWTPELRAAAEKLATTKYPSLRAGLQVLLKSEHRKPGHAERDAARHPVETLEFFKITPKQTVLEYSPGQGWYTELLAPLLASQGQLLVTTQDPAKEPYDRSTYYAERLKLLLDNAPELYGKVERLVVSGSQPELNVENRVDTALVIRGMHSWVTSKTTDAWLDQIHAALKKNGVLGIVQHRAPSGANPEETAPQGYLPEEWVIQAVEARGFKLQEKSEINQNPKDTKDYERGVWALPPSLALGEQDREKYEAIGESDRMTLRFVRVEK